MRPFLRRKLELNKNADFQGYWNSTKFVEFTTFMTTELNFYLSQYQYAAADI